MAVDIDPHSGEGVDTEGPLFHGVGVVTGLALRQGVGVVTSLWPISSRTSLKSSYSSSRSSLVCICFSLIKGSSGSSSSNWIESTFGLWVISAILCWMLFGLLVFIGMLCIMFCCCKIGLWLLGFCKLSLLLGSSSEREKERPIQNFFFLSFHAFLILLPNTSDKSL